MQSGLSREDRYRVGGRRECGYAAVLSRQSAMYQQKNSLCCFQKCVQQCVEKPFDIYVTCSKVKPLRLNTIPSPAQNPKTRYHQFSTFLITRQAIPESETYPRFADHYLLAPFYCHQRRRRCYRPDRLPMHPKSLKGKAVTFDYLSSSLIYKCHGFLVPKPTCTAILESNDADIERNPRCCAA